MNQNHRKLYVFVEKGYHLDNPHCFRCGDCCNRIPVEILQEEIDLISKRLNEHWRKLFLDSLTTENRVADPIDGVNMLPLSTGAAWIKAPCIFLDWEWKRKSGENFRSFCTIYKFKPHICSIFHCGKSARDEPLLVSRYKYFLSPSFRQVLEAEIKKAKGEEGWQETLKMIKEAEETERNHEAKTV